MPQSIEPLRHFIVQLSHLLDEKPALTPLLDRGATLLKTLVTQDDWLAPRFREPHPEHYQQYLLYADPLGRFSVVSFVWGPGQATPIHDHTVWGLIGVLQGAETSQRFIEAAQGLSAEDAPVLLSRGDIDRLSPQDGDIHQVRNAYSDQVSISVHVYGANIGTVRRHVFATDGTRKAFVSGYANDLVPNLWI